MIRGELTAPFPFAAIPSERLAKSPFDKDNVPEKLDASKPNVTDVLMCVQTLALQLPEKLVNCWPT